VGHAAVVECKPACMLRMDGWIERLGVRCGASKSPCCSQHGSWSWGGSGARVEGHPAAREEEEKKKKEKKGRKKRKEEKKKKKKKKRGASRPSFRTYVHTVLGPFLSMSICLVTADRSTSSILRLPKRKEKKTTTKTINTHIHTHTHTDIYKRDSCHTARGELPPSCCHPPPPVRHHTYGRAA